MLNAYPDSIGGTLSDIVNVLKKPEFEHTFSSFYILPSLFNTDLDRGFSVISYDLNESLVKAEDLKDLEKLGIDLKLDFILNHASVLSEQFQDILAHGEKSEYRDFFIDWNKFWEGYGQMTADGYIQPDEKYIKNMFFRKPGLPILMVRSWRRCSTILRTGSQRWLTKISRMVTDRWILILVSTRSTSL